MKPILLGMLLVAAAGHCFAEGTQPPADAKAYPDPKRFEKDILAFEEQDKTQPPPRGGIVCIGSSTMRGWHSNIRQHLAPLTVIPRGFGGSCMNDALYYADRIVIPYAPRAVLVYEGDNDIASGITPEKIRDTFRSFVEKTHKSLPDARIYVISIKPSIARWNMWPKMQAANKLLADLCAKDKRLIYVDTASPMLDSNSQVIRDVFLDDGLHMNRKGYELWRDVVRPVLAKAELKYEQAKDCPKP